MFSCYLSLFKVIISISSLVIVTVAFSKILSLYVLLLPWHWLFRKYFFFVFSCYLNKTFFKIQKYYFCMFSHYLNISFFKNVVSICSGSVSIFFSSFFFFCPSFDWPAANFQPLLRGQLHSPDVNHCGI